MTISFFLIVFQWWIPLFLIGIIFLPISQKLFKPLFDRGYIFSKILGLIIISYILLALSTVHLLPFTYPSLLLIIFATFIANVFLLKEITLDKDAIRIAIFEELLFFVLLVFWSFIRAFQPDIHGLEKFMDFGFVNSILRTTYFPPKDMWMTPLSINYYYFGHLMTAVLTRLSFLPSQVTFNLMIATLFSAACVGSFSLGANLFYFFKKDLFPKIKPSLIRFISAGLLSLLLVALAGNLHTIYTLFSPYENDSPVPPWSLTFSPTTFPNHYWYPNATRFIYHTIHEFPMYSFIVSDLHGHVLDIPLVLLTLTLLFVTILRSPETFSFKNTVVTLAFLCAVMYMTNAWDGAIYGLFSLMALLYKHIQKTNKTFFSSVFSLAYLETILGFAVTFFIFSLPFSFFFKPFASQIGLNCAPQFLLTLKHIGPLIFEQGYCQISPWWQLLILYGFFLFWIITLLVILSRQKKLAASDIFILLSAIVGVLLIVLPEFIYLKDIYTTYFRANTMFKLVYQSFILLSFVSAYTLLRLMFAIREKKSFVSKIRNMFLLFISAILVGMVGMYGYFGVMSYYENLQHFRGLDGTKYLQTIKPDDYAAIIWLNSHVTGQPVVVEAQGDSYTDFERISSNTGLPTIFGWTVHEWLWRGTYDVAPPRIADVKNLYEAPSVEEAKATIKKYNVRYIYIGDMERTKYQVNEDILSQLAKVIFKKGNVEIYKITL